MNSRQNKWGLEVFLSKGTLAIGCCEIQIRQHLRKQNKTKKQQQQKIHSFRLSVDLIFCIHSLALIFKQWKCWNLCYLCKHLVAHLLGVYANVLIQISCMSFFASSNLLSFWWWGTDSLVFLHTGLRIQLLSNLIYSAFSPSPSFICR